MVQEAHNAKVDEFEAMTVKIRRRALSFWMLNSHAPSYLVELM